jgi:transposase
MKKVNYYSDEFKRTVIQEVLDGVLSKEEARQKYGIKGNSAVLNWIRNFDGSNTVVMSRTKPFNQPEKSLKELEAENKRLKEELELERLRTRALNVMIDIAEEQLNIPIRKKSGAKQ